MVTKKGVMESALGGTIANVATDLTRDSLRWPGQSRADSGAFVGILSGLPAAEQAAIERLLGQLTPQQQAQFRRTVVHIDASMQARYLGQLASRVASLGDDPHALRAIVDSLVATGACQGREAMAATLDRTVQSLTGGEILPEALFQRRTWLTLGGALAGLLVLAVIATYLFAPY